MSVWGNTSLEGEEARSGMLWSTADGQGQRRAPGRVPVVLCSLLQHGPGGRKAPCGTAGLV